MQCIIVMFWVMKGNAVAYEQYIYIYIYVCVCVCVCVCSYNKTNWMHEFLKFIFGIKLYMFVFHCTHNSGICHTGLLTACEQDQDGRTAVPS